MYKSYVEYCLVAGGQFRPGNSIAWLHLRSAMLKNKLLRVDSLHQTIQPTIIADAILGSEVQVFTSKKNDPPDRESFFLVAGGGLEPPTFWL